MTCEDINQSLTGSATRRLPLEAENHLRSCRSCRALVAALSGPISEVSPSPASLRFIEASIAADLRPVRPIAPGAWWFCGLMAVYFAAVLWGISGWRALVNVMRLPRTGTILWCFAGTAGLLGNSLIKQIVPGSRHGIPPKLLHIAIMMFLTVAIALLFPFQPEDHLWLDSWACLRAGSGIAVLAAALLWLVLRRGAVLFPAVTTT